MQGTGVELCAHFSLCAAWSDRSCRVRRTVWVGNGRVAKELRSVNVCIYHVVAEFKRVFLAARECGSTVIRSTGVGST